MEKTWKREKFRELSDKIIKFFTEVYLKNFYKEDYDGDVIVKVLEGKANEFIKDLCDIEKYAIAITHDSEYTVKSEKANSLSMLMDATIVSVLVDKAIVIWRTKKLYRENFK